MRRCCMCGGSRTAPRAPTPCPATSSGPCAGSSGESETSPFVFVSERGADRYQYEHFAANYVGRTLKGEKPAICRCTSVTKVRAAQAVRSVRDEAESPGWIPWPQ
jgi:hypothetical protein